MGTAWNRPGEFTDNFIGGGGLGVRLPVPYIDMLRTDFGFGRKGRGIGSHIGLRKKADLQRQRVR